MGPWRATTKVQVGVFEVWLVIGTHTFTGSLPPLYLTLHYVVLHYSIS